MPIVNLPLPEFPCWALTSSYLRPSWDYPAWVLVPQTVAGGGGGGSEEGEKEKKGKQDQREKLKLEAEICDLLSSDSEEDAVDNE